MITRIFILMVTFTFVASCSSLGESEGDWSGKTGVKKKFGSQFKSKFVEINGSKIHYVESGVGDPILFIHGNPTSSYLWRNIMPKVSNYGRTIAIDLVGMGYSDKPNINYSYEDHAKYFKGFIKKLGLKNITLVVHDWGSFLGFDYAMKNPKNIKGLVFMEAMLLPVPSYEAMPPQVRDMMKALRTPNVGEKLGIEDNIFIEKILPSMTVRTLTKKEMDNYRGPYLEKESRKPLLMWPRELVIAGKPIQNLKRQQAYLEKLKKSEIPKLLLHATPGALMPKEMVQWCKNNLRNLNTVYLGEGRHFLQEDHPIKISDAIVSWYKKISQSENEVTNDTK